MKKRDMPKLARMYLAYKHELGTTDSDKAHLDDLDYFTYSEDVDVVEILERTGTRKPNCIGFFIVLKGLMQGYDYFIQETYIEPAYRRLGIMSKELRNYFETHKGKYGLYIMPNNIKAKLFWTSTAEGLHNVRDDYYSFGVE